jgi:uncharacterized repeat protein (TIGR02543 family)
LTAQPFPGQAFLGWSGDASGTQNPLTVAVTTNLTITATFTHRLGLAISGGIATIGGPHAFNSRLLTTGAVRPLTRGTTKHPATSPLDRKPRILRHDHAGVGSHS